MNGIPEATSINLSVAEHAGLNGLARSTKTEHHRLRQRARIVLLASGGMASPAIGRAAGCTTGTASKWRMRYAKRRPASLDDTGNRGAEPKYTAQTGKRIQALERAQGYLKLPNGRAQTTAPQETPPASRIPRLHE